MHHTVDQPRSGSVVRLERNHPYEERAERLDLLVAVGR